MLHDDIECEVVSQAGDIGDRELHSRSDTPRSSVENFMSVEEGMPPVIAGSNMHTFDVLPISTASVISPLPLDIVSSLSVETNMYPREKNPSGPVQTSLQHFKEFEKEVPPTLDYISCLLHLAVFGILGVFTRYLLQKLFGPQVADITNDRSLLYPDLPSNMVGSFLMGWFGNVFKRDISHVSDLLAIGLTTGYLGSVTTFSGWNQKMLDLSIHGRWVDAALGLLLGPWIAEMSITVGIGTAKGFRWVLSRFSANSKDGASCSRHNFRVNNMRRHTAVFTIMVLILGGLWGVSGAFLKKWHDGGNTNGKLWLACIVGPPGVWLRWFLARFNGRGLGRNGSMKWIPFGTLTANISASCLMASLATVKKVVNTNECDTYATGVQMGFLGCLSTVSTFVAEFHAMLESKHPWRAWVYALITILPSFGLGTLIYSVPVWTKGYHGTY
ncbi:hypothetical protein ACHQM5_003145 [Ranunculus cassubicifolius]